jgi:mono/diheme cytochrome c family protein
MQKQTNWWVTFGSLVFLAGCMEPSAPVEESGDKQHNQAITQPDKRPVVAFALPRDDLGDLAAAAVQLSIRVFSLSEGVRGEQEGEPFVFDLTDQGNYELTGLTLGTKEIEIRLLDREQNVLAKTVFQATVSLGEQVWDEVILQPIEPTPVAFAPAVQINLDGFPGEVKVGELPAAIDQILNDQGCRGCHNASAQQGQLDLSTFPFVSASDRYTESGLAGIVDQMIVRVESAEAPMPPFGDGLDDQQIQVLKDWRQTLRSASGGDADEEWISQVIFRLYWPEGGQFTSELNRVNGRYRLREPLNLFAGRQYQYDLLVQGADGAVLLADEGQTLTVPLTGEWAFDVQIAYAEPIVRLPIRVD